MSPLQPWATNTLSAVMMRRVAAATGSRTASRRARSGNQAEKRNESCGKAIYEIKADPPTVQGRPK